MLRIILLLVSICAIGCVLDGKDGAKGTDGTNHKQFVYTGVLYASDETAATPAILGYWDKTLYSINDSSIVEVYVRQGSGYMWITPTWLLSDSYIRISDDAKVDPAYEYKVIVSN